HPDATICFLSRCDRPPRSPLFPYTTLFRSLRAAQPGTVIAVAVLLIAQALLQMSFSAFQPLVALRLLVHAGSDVITITGITFGPSVWRARWRPWSTQAPPGAMATSPSRSAPPSSW